MRRHADDGSEQEIEQLNLQRIASLRAENVKLHQRVAELEATSLDETDGTFELRHLRQQNALLKARIDDLEAKAPITMGEAADRA